MFSRVGPWEIMLILLVLVLLFGAKRIPEIARSLGKSLGEFKKGQQEGGQDKGKDEKDDQKPAQG